MTLDVDGLAVFLAPGPSLKEYAYLVSGILEDHTNPIQKTDSPAQIARSARCEILSPFPVGTPARSLWPLGEAHRTTSLVCCHAT
jgi:hypothetical protein